MAIRDLERRAFIGLVGGTAAGSWLPHPNPIAITAGHAAQPAPRDPPARAAGPPDAPAWCDKAMRWAQLTLVENDPGRFDPQFWLDYFTARRTPMPPASAPAASSPTIPPTSRSTTAAASLGTTDPFGDLVKGCRALGMQVIARTDPHAAHDEVERQHPDWIAVDADGQRRRHWANPELWVTCALGPYNFEFMTAVHREIVTRYPVDGVFGNRWAAQRPVLVRALPRELQARQRPRPAAQRRSSRPRQARVHRLAAGAPHRAVAAVGRGDAPHQPRRALHPQRHRPT